MLYIGLINLIIGFFLVQDTFSKLNEGIKIIVFEQYFFGLVKYAPIILALSMILASVNLILRLTSSGLVHTYMNSFLLLLLYTPTVVFSKTDDKRFLILIIIQFLIMLACIILLYVAPGKTTFRKKPKELSKYQEYKQSMTKFEVNDKKGDQDGKKTSQ